MGFKIVFTIPLPQMTIKSIYVEKKSTAAESAENCSLYELVNGT